MSKDEEGESMGCIAALLLLYVIVGNIVLGTAVFLLTTR